METSIISKADLEQRQDRYCETINDEDYQMYLNVVENHNRMKAEHKGPMTGDVMIASSLDGKKVYRGGHIEFRGSDHSPRQGNSGELAVCVKPYVPIIHCTEKGMEFSANNVSGGYFFRPNDDEEIKYAGQFTKEFSIFGRNGGQADGTFNFQLVVNLWKVTSKEVY